MESAIHNLDFDIDDRVTGKHTAFDRFLDAVNHRWNVFFWNSTADDLIFNFDALAAFIGNQRNHRMAILPAATRLTNKLAFAFSTFRDRLAISDLRRAGVSADLKFPE